MQQAKIIDQVTKLLRNLLYVIFLTKTKQKWGKVSVVETNFFLCHPKFFEGGLHNGVFDSTKHQFDILGVCFGLTSGKACMGERKKKSD